MANEFRLRLTPGRTIYAELMNPAGSIYSSAIPGFDTTITAGEWANYVLTITEQSTTGYYFGNMPGGVPRGLYDVYFFEQAGGSPATTDVVVGKASIDWSGTAEVGENDTYDRIGTNGAGLTALGDTRLANLDTAVSSRMATFVYTAPLDAAGVRAAMGLALANLDTQLATIAGYIDTEIATLITSVGAGLGTLVTAIKAKTDNLPASPASTSDCITAAGVRAAIGLALANLDAQLGAIPASVLTTQMVESYAADGVAPTLAQALLLVQQRLTDFSKSGTSILIKGLNGSTTVATLTLDDATSPTSSTRSA